MKIKSLLFFILIAGYCHSQNPPDIETETLYQNFLHSGDTSFAAKHFENAAYYYASAIKLRPEGQFAKGKLCDTYVYIHNNTTCPYTTDQNEFNKKKSNYEILLGDSAFAKKDYYTARNNYYFAFWYVPGQPYAIKQARFCDSILNNEAFAKFETKYADSLFVHKDYRDARVDYEYAWGNFLGMRQYLVDTISYIKEKNYLEQQIAICDSKMSLADFNGLLSDERCDGMMSGYCWDICISAAKRAEALKDYAAAMEFYDRMGDSVKVEEMKKLVEKK